MKAVFAAAVLVVFAVTSVDIAMASEAGEVDEATSVYVEHVCNACHGPGGRSTNPVIPNLAAQPRLYLAARMRSLRDQSTSRPRHHVGLLGLLMLDDSGTDAIARYYAAQSPPAGKATDAAAIAVGARIYSQGSRDENIPACSTCHGANGTGRWIFPRLAGQHAEYLERQMTMIKRNLRDAPLMHGILKTMTTTDVKSVAAFAESLH